MNIIDMREEKQANFYNGIYSEPYNSKLDFVYNRVEEILKARLIFSAHVLEIGCGLGQLAKRLIPCFPDYLGVDFSSVAIDHCLREVDGLRHFLEANIYDKSLYGRQWDAVVGIEVMEHVDDITALSLIPGGVFVCFSVPFADSPAHLRTYTEPIIRERWGDLINIEAVEPLSPGRRWNDQIFIVTGTRRGN